MASHSPIYVFCYDVAGDKVRRRVSAILEQHGVRVQESVFEVRADHRRAEAILRLIDREIDPGDSIRAYCLTEEGRLASLGLGGAPMPEREEFWLL
jgi:CRISPR-associated protein Cas2